MTAKTNSKKSDWLLSIPVHNLVIDREINREIKIGSVIFVDKDKIPYIRKRLGIQERISDMELGILKDLDLRFFDECQTYAFHRCSNKTIDEAKSRIIKIREAYWILASSQIGYNGRHSFTHFGLPEHAISLSDEEYIFDIKSDSLSYKTNIAFQKQPYKLDRKWRNFVEPHFFIPLLKIINRKTLVNQRWRTKLKRAAIFAAKSFYSSEKETAFLYDWIAIESLLKTGKGKIDRTIVEHLIALFGWLTGEDGSYWKKIVEGLWKKRNEFFHEGIAEDITVRDILEADTIVYNLLNNLTRLTKQFPNQKSLNDFAEEVRARKILNMKIKRTKLFYQKQSITKRVVKELELKNGW